MIRVLIDGDACPVVKDAERISKNYRIPVTIFTDYSHEMHVDYAKVVYVGIGENAADFAIANKCRKGDIVVTADYGVAAMAMAKQAKCIHPRGFVYTDETLDRLLAQRDFTNKMRMRGIRVKRDKRKCRHFDFNGQFATLLIDGIKESAGMMAISAAM